MPPSRRPLERHCTARLLLNAFVRLSRSSLSTAANHTVTSNDKVMESETRTLPILSGIDDRLDATQRNAASVLKSNQLLAKGPGAKMPSAQSPNDS
ncbi:hypothetical protein HYALB_00001337 [Hymenoscyphus albidus]|uniref:Uncharacterized protein n=1 Tax=Hymenoscyphus albidus TaxID=595503 RepID=A0A9N9Q305_9HELO|nr:hypothetical protein HYALB_00001337 [Hymenoscyphus albidus]